MTALDQSNAPSDIDLRAMALTYAVNALNTSNAAAIGNLGTELYLPIIAYDVHLFLLGKYNPNDESTHTITEGEDNVIRVRFRKRDEDTSPDNV